MVPKKEDAGHPSSCLSTDETLPKVCAVITADGTSLSVPPQQQRKEDAKKVLYLDRI